MVLNLFSIWSVRYVIGSSAFVSLDIRFGLEVNTCKISINFSSVHTGHDYLPDHSPNSRHFQLTIEHDPRPRIPASARRLSVDGGRQRRWRRADEGYLSGRSRQLRRPGRQEKEERASSMPRILER